MDAASVLNTKFLMVFAFGLTIVFLYAKEKFNVPTYDKDVTGPFAQLPPQFLTMDSRYRVGRRTYLTLMVALYTVVSLIGPNIITVDPTIRGLIPKEFQDAKELWPVAAATFLVYTGSAKDTSVVGRIELAIRQYAHKKAYIPDGVFGLSASLRNLDIARWLEDTAADEKEVRERRAALAKLITPECFAKFEQNPEQEGELATWARANILFHAFDRLFGDRQDVVDVRMDHLIEAPEQKASRERVRKERDRLAGVYKCSPEADARAADDVFADMQRLLRDASLALAVLLSQAARHPKDLSDRLEQLGFQTMQDRDRSDHTLFMMGVSAAIIAGAVTAGLLLALSELWRPETIGMVIGLVTIGIAVLIYVVAFRSIDYQRDRMIDSLDWSEDLKGYAQTVVPASILASIACLVTVMLVYFAINSLTDISRFDYLFGANSVAGIIEQSLRQFLLAFLASVFFVRYMREAARVSQDQARFRRQILSVSAAAHAVGAAVLVAVFAILADAYTLYDTPKKFLAATQTNFDLVKEVMDEPDERIWFADKYLDVQIDNITEKLSVVGGSWTRPDGKTSDLIDQKLAAVRAICGELNMPKNQEKPPPKRLFKDADDCEPNTMTVSAAAANPSKPTPEEIKFEGLAWSLQGLLDSLNKLKKHSDLWLEGRHYTVWAFPALIIFIITYAFGVGCRFSRAWLLYKDADRENSPIAKFREQLRVTYGESVDADRCLIHPLSILDYLTPLEGLRYPDYRAKLFAKLQKKKIKWPLEFYQDEAKQETMPVRMPGEPAPTPA